MTQLSITLKNVLFFDGNEFNSKDLSFNQIFTTQNNNSLVIDATGYIALPGFVNAAIHGDNVKVLEKQTQLGFTTNICLTSLSNIPHRTATVFAKEGLSFVHNSKSIKPISPFKYELHAADGSIHTIQSIPDLALKSGAFYGSGDISKHSSNIWATLFSQTLNSISNNPNSSDPLQLLKDLTVNPATALGLENVGCIAEGYFADFILFKIMPEWDLSNTDTILQSLFMHAGNDGRAFAVFKKGQLLYAHQEFKTTYEAATLSLYYIKENDPEAAKGIKDSHKFDTIESALEAFRMGEFVIVVDNEDRENEGDLIIAGEELTAEKMAFMIRYTSGVICAPAEQSLFERLDIPMMVEQNEDSLKTAYTVSVDAKENTTTGISAQDRATTIKLLADPNCKATSFQRPGHVFPLRAVEGGVLKRVGHTEASVDLCKLSGKYPVAAISEICLDDGTMARRDHLVVFAKRWNMKLITINDLVKYRLEHNL
ncbi:DHBP synthase RibB-like alpha/beta domain-containing protein [Globomyces pollinis-pini]|nr:DHBP synthase RibB-like alpha/beta domain-containing protein [Globomyces pollinis-pini]